MMASRKGGSRHLIYFIDGTWLWSGSDKNLDVYSNIWRMNLLLDADDDDGRAQVVHYSRGLGAVDDTIGAYVAGGLAFGIDELIADLYVNICSNYQRGDKIYIFGFSRGACSGVDGTTVLRDTRGKPLPVKRCNHGIRVSTGDYVVTPQDLDRPRKLFVSPPVMA